MTIGVDGNEANVEKPVGVSVYTLEMLSYFARHACEKIRFVVYLRAKPLPHIPLESEYFKYAYVPGKAFWRDIFFPMYLYLHRDINVLFSPAHYTPRFCPVPTVVTIHDLGYVFYPQDFLKKDLYKLEMWTKHAVSRSKKIIAVSQHTKNDIHKHYNIPLSTIECIYNGYTKQKNSLSHASLQKYGVEDKKYFLYASTLQPRKNVTSLIEAFAQFNQNATVYKLILVGKKGWMYHEMIQRVQDLNLEHSITFTGYIPDADLSLLYKHATAYVFPALYEGFGMTILEAMHHHCPVIASSSGALPEIAGEACLYFEPHDTIKLQESMTRLAQSDVLRKELIAKGLKQVQKFSWDKSASKTLRVLQESAQI